MITIIAMPKPFKGHIDVIQRNAIRSWKLLKPECEIIVFGDEEGVKETASEFGLTHISNIKRNEFGTPLLSDFFEQAQKIAKNDIICFVNADIILMSDFTAAVKRIASNRSISNKGNFLMIGRRRNLNIDKSLDYSINWEQQLISTVRESGTLNPPGGTDYFVFKRGLWNNIPDFAIGRPGYDNWLIYKARSMGVPVIDTTEAVISVHQNHDYSHVKNKDEGYFNGPETKRNLLLIGGQENIYGVYDADWILRKQVLKPVYIHRYFNKLKRTVVKLITTLQNNV